MNTTTNNTTVRIYKVTCSASESVYTSMMIWSNTGSEDSDRAAVTDTATRYAKHHGYTLVSVDEITEREAQTLINRGMSYNHIDETAERDHDPSFATEDTDPAEVDEAVADAVADEVETFPHLAALIRTASEERAAALRCFIENGYFPTWTNRDRENADPDMGLREYSTKRRLEQYQSGEITREKAVELAAVRAAREVKKEREARFARLNTAADAAPLQSLTISIEWHRSRTWGYNPEATATSDTRRTFGRASGCGYDKGSAAVADALNQNPQTLRFLFERAEAALAEGANPHDKKACTGYCWNGVLGYGSGYSVLPYFEGGVGITSTLDLFTRGGCAVDAVGGGRLFECYTVRRAESATA